eukprot:CAMPEP_0201512558 /NCGR_PEP_ID=MMETSP0161_2-20130828/4791_1 /ASSEMBLY_ACC=CAM_ASM_000251 /TAXON_ID=180227 /ORGANISM="Neoparamoeba aestuarina, Strain SoJaBio B1-5/56/2" /LENGTH=231 /DNA_ID=CAMNT_0047908443 /DNA_START=9 /DNA_END=701 /DNA_ORIENTATION=-
MLIIVAGGNIEEKDNNGATPLYYSVAFGSVKCYDLLIEYGADVNVVTNEGDTLLHASIAKNHTDITLRLLARDNAPYDKPNNQKMTPLHLAASWGRRSCASLLITKGADIDAQTQLGNTALHLSVLRLGKEQEREDEEGEGEGEGEGEWEEEKTSPHRTIEVLLDKGSDWKKRNNNNYTPIHLAALVGGPRALKLLLAHAKKSCRIAAGRFHNQPTTTCYKAICKEKEKEK